MCPSLSNFPKFPQKCFFAYIVAVLVARHNTAIGHTQSYHSSILTTTTTTTTTTIAAVHAGIAKDGSFPLSRILVEFDKMTGLLRKHILPRSALVQAAQALQSMGLVEIRSEFRVAQSIQGHKAATTAEYRCRLVTDLEELKVAFTLAPTLGVRGSASASASASASTNGLAIPDHVRKAILDPLEPISLPNTSVGLL
jgi:hypothetical protein